MQALLTELRRQLEKGAVPALRFEDMGLSHRLELWAEVVRIARAGHEIGMWRATAQDMC